MCYISLNHFYVTPMELLKQQAFAFFFFKQQAFIVHLLCAQN